jgi:hypothetical protein
MEKEAMIILNSLAAWLIHLLNIAAIS